jgi:hypothetical protein
VSFLTPIPLSGDGLPQFPRGPGRPRGEDATTAGHSSGIGRCLALNKGLQTPNLATAVSPGADRFITNNQRDFPAGITEIHITYLTDLPDRIG